MAGGITIPAGMHRCMIDAYRKEYADEFGEMDHNRAYTRGELIRKYARDILFWKKREPVLDSTSPPSIQQICAHAICTNAVTNMWTLCRNKHIEQEVRQFLSKPDVAAVS